jgi:NAD(P)-dependent dehydrogenase (short-subunit alcohol dehydrogenase family)
MSGPFAKFDLAGKTALVTGGATGLGYHMTKALAEAGATVLIAARREAVLCESAERLNSDAGIGGRVHWRRVDLGDRASVAELASHALERFGGIDIYVGNAALDFHMHVENIKDDAMDLMLQANIASNVALVRAFLPGMRARKWGRVIFSSSATTVAASPFEGASLYTAVKGALNAFTRTLATEVGHDNITANALILGFFVTDMVTHAQDHIRAAEGDAAAHKFLEDFVGMTALGRGGRPEELEGLIQLLASDAGSFITGSCLVVDGGLSIMLRPNGMVG